MRKRSCLIFCGSHLLWCWSVWTHCFWTLVLMACWCKLLKSSFISRLQLKVRHIIRKRESDVKGPEVGARLRSGKQEAAVIPGVEWVGSCLVLKLLFDADSTRKCFVKYFHSRWHRLSTVGGYGDLKPFPLLNYQIIISMDSHILFHFTYTYQ